MADHGSAGARHVRGRGDARAKWYSSLWGHVFRLGFFPRRWVRLEVAGRVSGRPITCPLGMADVDGHWYLVSMLGECNWVANVRAAEGRAVLRRRTARPVVLTEVPADRRAPILRRYVDKVPGSRPHFPLRPGTAVREFEHIADSYPVFEVVDDRHR